MKIVKIEVKFISSKSLERAHEFHWNFLEKYNLWQYKKSD